MNRGRRGEEEEEEIHVISRKEEEGESFKVSSIIKENKEKINKENMEEKERSVAVRERRERGGEDLGFSW